MIPGPSHCVHFVLIRSQDRYIKICDVNVQLPLVLLGQRSFLRLGSPALLSDNIPVAIEVYVILSFRVVAWLIVLDMDQKDPGSNPTSSSRSEVTPKPRFFPLLRGQRSGSGFASNSWTWRIPDPLDMQTFHAGFPLKFTSGIVSPTPMATAGAAKALGKH